MFGFIRKRRTEAQKRKALELGASLMDQVNSALDRWREERLLSRRDMTANMFDERLVKLEPTDGLAFAEVAEIEALACMKNWHERRNEYAAEAATYLTDDDVQFLDLVGGGEKFTEVVYEKIDEVSGSLEAHIDESIADACRKRGEEIF